MHPVQNVCTVYNLYAPCKHSVYPIQYVCILNYLYSQFLRTLHNLFTICTIYMHHIQYICTIYNLYVQCTIEMRPIQYKMYVPCTIKLSLPYHIYPGKILSQPKINQQLSSTEFEVRLHSYIDHPTHSTQTQLVYSKLDRADNCPASKQGPVCTTVQCTVTHRPV